LIPQGELCILNCASWRNGRRHTSTHYITHEQRLESNLRSLASKEPKPWIYIRKRQKAEWSLFLVILVLELMSNDPFI
jgi:hypothetical protein